MLACPSPTVYMPRYLDAPNLWTPSGKLASSFKKLRSQPNHHQPRQRCPFAQGKEIVLKVSAVVMYSLYKIPEINTRKGSCLSVVYLQ
jgi:hypothetical protein